MSTELKGTENFRLTQFAGGDRGLCLQITARAWKLMVNQGKGDGYIQITADDVLPLATGMLEWKEGDRQVCGGSDPVYLTDHQRRVLAAAFPDDDFGDE